jgi:phosphoribosylformimino-5-aminoimidazole carboxamide ribotide isomerase
MILVIPAIDLRDGRCVRLVQGAPGTERVYSNDPIQMAVLWRGENAKMLHIVDLDGAIDGEMKNLDVIKKIIEAVEIPIQVGGGIRTYEQARNVLEAGAGRVVISTAAIQNVDLVKRIIAEFGPRRVVIAIDARNNIVQVKGWQENSGMEAVPLGLNMKSIGVERVLYTDITRDGTLSGPNFSAIKEFAVKTGLKITASGGVSGYEDLRRMQDLEQYGVDSIIVGRALYENRFPCQDLWRMCEGELEDLGPTRRV